MKEILNWIFPPRCPLCDGVTQEVGKLCSNCLEGPYPERVTDPFCLRCGKQLERERDLFCYDCSGGERRFKAGRAPFQYRGMEPCMYRFKNGRRREFSVYLGREMAKLYLEELSGWRVEGWIPVPIHASRYRVRGYNQAALLARELEKCTGIPVEESLLIRKKKTVEQRYMDDRQRFANMRDAFAVTGNCEWKRVCIVDDIFTTGSTCEAAAEVLKKAGAKEVFVLCACIGRGM